MQGAEACVSNEHLWVQHAVCNADVRCDASNMPIQRALQIMCTPPAASPMSTPATMSTMRRMAAVAMP